MQKLSSLLFTTFISISMIAIAHESMGQTSAVASAPSVVSTNDSPRPAGRLEEDVLNVRLVAGIGRWHPKGSPSTPIEVAALGEEGADLFIPLTGPRRNDRSAHTAKRAGSLLWVHACARDHAPAIPVSPF